MRTGECSVRMVRMLHNSGGYTCIPFILPEEVMYQKKNEVNISDNIHIKMYMPINDII